MIDLHCHTNCSDGSDSPRELVRKAVEARLEGLAITDHDTFEGYDLAKKYASETGLQLVCGVELSSRSAQSIRSVHLLGYFAIDAGTSFRSWLSELQRCRRERNAALQERLRELKMDISWAELEAIGTNQIGRPHFARLMVDKGYVASPREAFDLYLSEGGLAWIEHEVPRVEEAVERIASAGGIASLAHPGRIAHDAPTLNSLISELVPQGLQAIECFHPELSQSDIGICLSIANEYGLLITGGSDYHGSYKPDIKLGTGIDGVLNIPASVLHALMGRIAHAGALRCASGKCEND